MSDVYYDTTQIVEFEVDAGTFEAFGVFVSEPAWYNNTVEVNTEELAGKHVSLAGEGNIVGLEIDGEKEDNFYRVTDISRERSEFKKVRLTDQNRNVVVLTRTGGSNYLVENFTDNGTTATDGVHEVRVLPVPDEYLMSELGQAHQIIAERI